MLTVAVPLPTAVTTPEESTVQIDVSELDQLTPEAASPFSFSRRSLKYSPIRDMVTSEWLME